MAGELFKEFMDKDITRLNELHIAYDQQRIRVLKMMEYDAKRIGIKRVASSMGVEWSYLYRTFAGGYLSHEKIMDMYLKIKELKDFFGVYDE